MSKQRTFFSISIQIRRSCFHNLTFTVPTLDQDGVKWLRGFENYLIAMNIEEDVRKRALMLHYAGPQVYDIFDTFPDTGDAKDYKIAKDALSKYFSPKPT